ncbi:MAG: ferritin-like domain-containing protein [Bacillota bacterium]
MRQNLPEVQTRNELIYLLYQASELEHSLLCQYLYTAFTIKQPGEDRKLTNQQQERLHLWGRQIYHVAVQEMLHLCLAANLLTAVGGAPNLRRPNFPQPKERYPLGLPSELAPFSLETIERYKKWEEPEFLEPPTTEAPLMPRDLTYKTIGELYHIIETAFRRPDAQRWLIGPARAQVTNQLFPFQPPVIAVTNPEAACRAVQLIVEEGEGTPPRADGSQQIDPNSHYGIFSAIVEGLKEEPPGFAPAWATVHNPIYHRHYDAVTPEGAHQAVMVEHPATRAVGELFNALYDLMCQWLMRLFAHTEESDEQLRILATSSMELMSMALQPVGIMLTRMPVAVQPVADAEGLYPTAGPSFEMYSFTQPLPHMGAAWTFFHERIREIADHCQILCHDEAITRFAASQWAFSPVQRNIPHTLFEVAAVLETMIDRFKR